MSISVMTKIWETNLPTPEKMVLLVIADKANDDGTNSWPGVDTIARKSSMTRRSVQRHIRNLEERGIIVTLRQQGGNEHTREDRRPNRYDIILTALHGVTDCLPVADGVTSETARGDSSDRAGRQTEPDGVTPMSPYTSLSIHDPSVIHPGEIVEAEIVQDWELSFAQFWSLYPRKIAKVKASALWRKLKPDERDAALDAIPVHVQQWRQTKTGKEFIPHPTTWLNARRWEDEFTGDYQPQGSLVQQAARFALEAEARRRHDGSRSDGSDRRSDGNDYRVDGRGRAELLPGSERSRRPGRADGGGYWFGEDVG